MPSDHGLIAWQSDIRGVMSFNDLNDISAKRGDIADIINRWLALD
jgi:hypothetical protein